MKFEKDGMKFEVSNLDHIVINNVRQIIKPAEVTDKGVKPARVTNEKVRVEEKGTRVWVRLYFKKGRRWAKFRYHGEIPLNDPNTPYIIDDAEDFGSTEQIQKVIMDAMQRPDVRLWFSGTYVNIEICENWQEVQKIKAQEERRKSRSRAAKILRSPNIGNILQDAIQKSTAQFRQEAIDTPFGPIPVMTITGSSRRK